MKVDRLQLGNFNVNCYILRRDNKCIIVDPGAEPETIKEHISYCRLEPLFIINTHCHYDHIGAIQDIKNHYKIKFYIHPKEEAALLNPEINLSALLGKDNFTLSEYTPIDSKINLRLKKMGIDIIHTPGHSQGSISMHIENFILCGDLLFKGSIGRADLPGGDMSEIKNSLKKIRKMDKNLVIYPGHGPRTILEDELYTNYYLSEEFL